MLADQFLERFHDRKQHDRVYPDGTRHFDGFAPLVERVGRAAVYELDPDAVAMAANVSLGKPSSMIAALPWTKLPAPVVWMEFANQDLRTAMAGLGSPNVTHGTVAIERTGFLLTQVGDGFIRFECVHRDRDKDGRESIDLSPVVGTFDGKRCVVERPVLPPVERDGRVGPGRMRRHLDLVATDEAERAAEGDMHARVLVAPHPDMAKVTAACAAFMGREKVDGILLAQGNEARRFFLNVVLPALVLINCRNAVDEVVERAPEKLNKARAKRGKRPLLDRVVLRMHLTPKQHAQSSASGDCGRAMRAALVVGHFKVRRPGKIFWWRMHARSGWGEPAKIVRRVGA